MSLAASLSYSGEFERSLELATRAVTLLDGDDKVAAMSQQAGLLQRAGRHPEALRAFDCRTRGRRRHDRRHDRRARSG